MPSLQPMPTNITRIKTLNHALEQARNEAFITGFKDFEDVFDSIVEDAKELEPILQRYVDQVKQIKADPELNDTGISNRLGDVLEELVNAILKIDKTKVLEEGVQTAERNLEHSVEVTIDNNRDLDDTLDYMKLREMRDYLFRHREEARREHEEYLENERKNGTHLPDQMRRFNDPVETQFLQAARSYSEKTDQLYRAVAEAPFPMQLLSEETLEKGKLLMQKAAVPDRYEYLQKAKARQLMYGHLYQAIQKAVDQPESLVVLKDDFKAPVSDQDRKEV